jgi:hypothetical protein
MRLVSIIARKGAATMGTARTPEPVKLIASLLTGQLELLDKVSSELVTNYGPIDFASELLPFDHTDYYAAEHGRHLKRLLVTFERLVDPGELPVIKNKTNQVEASLIQDGKRPINIDPGYVALGKMVLASTKDHAHRIYLSQGVYAENTLTYQRGHFRPWPWTYPDYGSEEYCVLFDGIRERYKMQLRETEAERDALAP